MSIKFKPTTTGTRTGSLTVNDNASGSPQVVSLTGTGATATSGTTLSFSPTSLSFASQAVGTISSAQFVTFTNTGSSTINFGTETIAGDFTWGGLGTCGSSLAVGGNCTMSIKFKPTTTGTRTGSLTVNDNASGSPQVISLTGTSTGTTSAPAVIVTPSSLSFGNQIVGTTSAAQMVVLKNSGTANLSVSGISVSPSQFAVAAAPTLPLTLTPGQSANIGVTFTPSVSSSISGTLSIVSNAASSPTAVSLSGSGVQSSPSPVSITTSALPGGTQQQAYSATLTATGGTTPYSWSLASGSLPSGLSLGASSGSITGTPTVAGSFPFTAQVKDASGPTAQKALSLSIAAAISGLPNFGHVVIVAEENTNYSSVTSSSMPYLSGLMTQYGLATQYYANTHPSIGNYQMLTTGQVLTNNDSQTPSSFPVSADNVVRELVAAGKSWKAYAESLPSVGYLGGDSTAGGGQYYVRHVPLAYLTDVQNSSAQQQNLVPFTQFSQDLSASNLPNYSFITPNGCDDAHDCGLGTADNWLKTNIDPLVKNAAFQKDGLLIVVFDESSNDNTNGGGRVVCALISPAFSKLGYQSTTIYQHQSLLRLTLEGLGVTVLPGAASSAPAMWEFFGTSSGGSTPPSVTTTTLPNGTVAQAYSAQLNATGGTSPYSWSVSSGSLPAGLSLSPSGMISGTPTTAGTPTFTATVSDASSQTASRNFTLTIGTVAATACTLYVSPSGSDSNPGTLSAPWQTPQKAANSAAAGQTVCFRGGTYSQTVTSGYQQTFNNSGSQGSPIVFTNYPGEVAVIQGSTRINGSYLAFRGTPQSTGSCDGNNHCGLVFEGSQGYAIDNIDICCAVNSAPHSVLFDHVEIRYGTYHAGLYQEGCSNSIVGSYVHDNGAFTANRSEDNGIYWSTTTSGCSNGGLIANNLVENNYSKGIQLYDGGSATSPANVTVTENTSVNNGAQGAVVWGDHNVFVNNVLYSNNNLSGGAAAGAQGGLYSGSTNLVDHNLTFDPTGSSGWDNPAGCCITNNKQGDPLFLSPSGLDWHILTSSPAIGFSNMSYIQPVDKDGISRATSPAAGAYQP
jgi:acid phosphatase